MSLPQNYQTLDTLTAAGNLSADEYKLMKQTATGVALCGDGEPAIGSLVSGGMAKLPDAAGLQTSVARSGEIPAMASGPLTAGIEVCSDANGKLRAAVIGTDSIFGILLEAATADGQIVIVQK
jgi:hypothetical protein